MSTAPTPVPAPAAGRAGMKKELPERFKVYKHVWVFVEYEHGQIHPVSLELLGEGRKLADKLHAELAGVVLGGNRQELHEAAVDAWEHGADLVYVCADPILQHYRNEPYTKVMTDLVNTYQPEIVLLGATVLGRDLAGAVATTLLTGLTADCTELAIDDEGSLAATRPTFGGSLLCTIHTLNFRPQMATIRPRVMSMPVATPGHRGRIIEHSAGLEEIDIITKVLRFSCRTGTATRLSLPMRISWSRAGWGFGHRKTCNTSERWRRSCGVSGADLAHWCKRDGWKPTGKSGRPERRSDRNYISPPGFQAPFNIALGLKAPTPSLRSTPIATRRSWTSRISASWRTRLNSCRR